MPKVRARNEIGVSMGGIIGAAFIASSIERFARGVAEGRYEVKVSFVDKKVKRRGKDKS